MNILKTISELRRWRESLRVQGETLSFVPTMGALHHGHMALVKEALKQADKCLPYIFLNPKQFAASEDLDKYPQTLDADLEKLSALGIDTVYVPKREEIYPEGFQTSVSVSHIAKPLEGEFRPDFFNGVTTIVCKMFLQSLPDTALFGEKDFQQLQVIKRMVVDLNFPIKIIGVPTVRDENGLALSSRNQYLSSAQYDIAIRLNKIIRQMALKELSANQAIQKLHQAGFDKVDYCTARNSETFRPENPNRVLVAAWIDKTRLIDNMAMVE